MLSKLLGRTGHPVVERVEPTLSVPAAAAEPNDFQRPEQWGLTTMGGTSSAGVRVTERTAMSLSAVMQAMRILTGVFAMTPLIYYRRTANGGRERATDSPLYQLFHDQPNGYQTPFGFKELLLADICLAGRYASYISRDYRQTPTVLTRLDPRGMALAYHFDRQTGITPFFDVTLPDGVRERFGADQVWHIPGFTRDGLTGIDPITYMREVLGGALATTEFANRFWANGAKPGTILKGKGKITKPDKEDIKQDWKARFGGPTNVNEVAVLDQDMTAEFLTHDNEKAQHLETRIFQVSDVSRAFGVPPHLLFELSRSTNNNIEHQSLEFVTYHMTPHYTRVAEAATLAFAEPGCFYEFLPDALLKGDSKSRWESYKAARELGALNTDEIRSRENLNAIGGVVGTSYLWPLNYYIAGTERPKSGAADSKPKD
ncbi:phage portal protein [Azospirillum argentinense]